MTRFGARRAHRFLPKIHGFFYAFLHSFAPKMTLFAGLLCRLGRKSAVLTENIPRFHYCCGCAPRAWRVAQNSLIAARARVELNFISASAAASCT